MPVERLCFLMTITLGRLSFLMPSALGLFCFGFCELFLVVVCDICICQVSFCVLLGGRDLLIMVQWVLFPKGLLVSSLASWNLAASRAALLKFFTFLSMLVSEKASLLHCASTSVWKQVQLEFL